MSLRVRGRLRKKPKMRRHGLQVPAAVAGAAFAVLTVLFAATDAHADQIYDNTEPEIDFSDTSGDEDLPEELRGKVLTEDLQKALQEAMDADDTDPEAMLDARMSGDQTAEENQSGMIDPTDGTSVLLLGDAPAITFNEIALTEHPPLTVSYDEERKRFIYEFPNGATFSMTAPLGGMANEPVTIEAEEGMELIGLSVDDVSLIEEMAEDALEEEERSEPVETEKPVTGAVFEGDAVTVTNKGDVQFVMFSDGVSNGEAKDSYLLRGSVRILDYDELVGIHYIGTPPGLTLSLITCNGERQEADSPYGVKLVGDGNYQLLYTFGRTEWLVTFRRDTTPPMLLFSEPLEGKKFDHPVSWQVYRKGVDVTVYLNNTVLLTQENMVYADGQYRIRAADQAGNYREYRFVIARGMTIHPEYALLALGVLVVFGAVVVLLYRRRLTVL